MARNAQSREQELLRRIAELSAQLEEPQQTIDALRQGQVDALVMTEDGSEPDVFSLKRAWQVAELEEVARAIQAGEVDALVMRGVDGEAVFTLHEVQQALHQSEERLRFALESASMIAWEWDPETDKVQLSSDPNKISRSHAPEPVTMSLEQWLARILDDDRQCVRDALHSSVREQTAYHVEYRIRDPQGDERWIADWGRLIVAERHGARLSGVCMDITDRKLAEQELSRRRDLLEQMVEQRTKALEESHAHLRRAERLAALGTLSAGLGHDMGNLLMPLNIRLDAIEREADSSEIKVHLTAIREATRYLQKLTRGLRMFVEDVDQQPRDAEPFDLHEWWPEVEPFLRNSLPRHIRLSADLCSTPVRIRMVPNALAQVLFNLVQNAGDAMRDRPEGSVHIEFSFQHHGWMNVLVRDTGPGMSEEVIRHCMEPFFTTKPRGISTGLGLAIVHSLVKRAGGSIDIKSRIGDGTTFILNLPTVDASEVQASEPELDAYVSIDDARLRSYFIVLLKARNFRVRDGFPVLDELGAAPILCLTSEIPSALQLRSHLVRRNDNSQVVVLGEPEAVDCDDPCLTVISPSASAATIRERLMQICSRCIGMSRTAQAHA